MTSPAPVSPPPPGPPAGLGDLIVHPKRRGPSWFTGANLTRWFFQSNALVAVIVLLLIAATLFLEAAGFVPANQRNLEIYRRAGLEFVDLIKHRTDDHREVARYLGALRVDALRHLTSPAGGGLSLAEANARMAALDAYAERFEDAGREMEGIVGELREVVVPLKERFKVSQDNVEARAILLRGIESRPPEEAARLREDAAKLVVETIDFEAELAPLRDLLPAYREAAERYTAALGAVQAEPLPAVEYPRAAERLERFRGFVGRLAAEIPAATARLEAWRYDAPVRWWESLSAFAFGRDWITASFWQDWYGVLPLLTGSLLIASIALALAIPFGVCAAIYVNQIATPAEQRAIKPTIEFIAAIPSVVLGFFGIAVLGSGLREVSQLSWLAWVPGFPMSERLTALTAGCLLALMAVPTIFSLAEDAINNVPRAFKEASFALGATRLQTIVRIIVPASLSGIFAAVLLGLGRVIGETMVVLLCAGNRIEIPDLTMGFGAFVQPVHTMTGIIAQEMGEVVRGSLHYRALFMVGCVLFVISLAINYFAQRIVMRYKISVG